MSLYDLVYIYVTLRKDIFLRLLNFGKLQMKLKLQVSIYHFTVSLYVLSHCFRLFRASSLKLLPAACKGMKHRKCGFNTIK